MKANEMHYFSDLFDKVLCIFRTCPLSIIRSISALYTLNRYLSSQFCWRLLADANRTGLTNIYWVCTVLRYSWWWTVDMSEMCRVLYQINMRNSASRLVHYKNISRFTVLWMSNSLVLILIFGKLREGVTLHRNMDMATTKTVARYSF